MSCRQQILTTTYYYSCCNKEHGTLLNPFGNTHDRVSSSTAPGHGNCCCSISAKKKTMMKKKKKKNLGLYHPSSSYQDEMGQNRPSGVQIMFIIVHSWPQSVAPFPQLQMVIGPPELIFLLTKADYYLLKTLIFRTLHTRSFIISSSLQKFIQFLFKTIISGHH